MALAAKAFDKPVYGLAESCVCCGTLLQSLPLKTLHSYKFLRLYPLSQQDLPTPVRPLTATSLARCPAVDLTRPPTRPMRDTPMPLALEMTPEMVEDQVCPSACAAFGPSKIAQPLLDYVLPDLVRAVISDLAVLTPSVRRHSARWPNLPHLTYRTGRERYLACRLWRRVAASGLRTCTPVICTVYYHFIALRELEAPPRLLGLQDRRSSTLSCLGHSHLSLLTALLCL